MSYKRVFSLICLTMTLCLFAACTTKEDSSRVISKQIPVEDDLEASLEEAVLTLSTHVSDMISSVNNLGSPKGTIPDKQNQYSDWESKLELLDERIDELENALDSNFRSGHISQETYTKLNRELSSLEQLVDTAEDKLEQLFYMVD